MLEEPKVLVEMNKLIEKKNELNDKLNNGRKILANITEYGSKQLLRLGMTTKKVYNVRKPTFTKNGFFLLLLYIFYVYDI